ncbi:hypothetical protein N9137_01095 [Pseudomonadales bacterium]|nr:hypothetical protein [Pseudomonadales bacterium]
MLKTADKEQIIKKVQQLLDGIENQERHFLFLFQSEGNAKVQACRIAMDNIDLWKATAELGQHYLMLAQDVDEPSEFLREVIRKLSRSEDSGELKLLSELLDCC